MSMRTCRNAFAMVLIFCLCCVALLAFMSVYIDYSGTQPFKPPEKRADLRQPTKTHDVKEKTVSLSPCPGSMDLPDEQLTPRKDPTTLQKVNFELLGNSLQKTLEATDIANKSLPSIIVKRKSIQEAASSIDQTISEMNLAVDFDDYRLLPGGHWIPLSCKSLLKVAIVVPFRNRFDHLPIFLRHIVPLLKRQKLEFSIFISEQRNDIRFNRAMLMNVGFVEALNFTNFDCVVFHDIDHLALNVKNYFGCENMPRHFISGEAMWGWKIIYENLFGGVTGITKQQFYTINGLSNVYWGWGGEDDDFAGRVQSKGHKRTRPQGKIGYFDTVIHGKKESSAFNEARFCLLRYYKQRMPTDGVSNLRYEPPTIELHPLYTNISVNIQKLPWNPSWHRCPGQ
ncbi:beta-1,4-galactosyltransferase 5 isoform X2 [Strongylocentrotus purpuratus]|uniref:Beta-1,4-galactosyltransferase n=1 Tax=Strongylocentrotus purpuratus TaxID=7668 RepID=A0A7M7RCC2_STRPU|nr:beta-1,4-galactosyltransferase 5 isoform X2 [Strongylocentrotus purpuratus]|eukprot:XP_779931.2 PREDICTED: beta-1,4-galactosyltransferase 6 isoform X2 [Strongylocentrotus purpuratus]